MRRSSSLRPLDVRLPSESNENEINLSSSLAGYVNSKAVQYATVNAERCLMSSCSGLFTVAAFMRLLVWVFSGDVHFSSDSYMQTIAILAVTGVLACCLGAALNVVRRTYQRPIEFPFRNLDLEEEQPLLLQPLTANPAT